MSPDIFDLESLRVQKGSMAGKNNPRFPETPQNIVERRAFSRTSVCFGISIHFPCLI